MARYLLTFCSLDGITLAGCILTVGIFNFIMDKSLMLFFDEKAMSKDGTGSFRAFNYDGTELNRVKVFEITDTYDSPMSVKIEMYCKVVTEMPSKENALQDLEYLEQTIIDLKYDKDKLKRLLDIERHNNKSIKISYDVLEKKSDKYLKYLLKPWYKRIFTAPPIHSKLATPFF